MYVFICYHQHTEILLNQYRNKIVFTIFRLFWNSKRTSVWFQINRKMVNTNWFLLDSIRFRKKFSLCTVQNPLSQNSTRFSTSHCNQRWIAHVLGPKYRVHTAYPDEEKNWGKYVYSLGLQYLNLNVSVFWQYFFFRVR